MDYHELEKMTVNRLREEAKKFPDLKGVTAMKKDELLHILVEKLGIAVPEKKKKAARAALTKLDLKRKVAELRAAREASRSEHNKKQVDLLRRRIHALKHRIRRMG